MFSQPLQRSISANDYSDKEFLPRELTRNFKYPSRSEMANRACSFSDKLPVVSQAQKHRASSQITFNALDIPAVVKSRRAAEFKEPKAYSSKLNFRYYGRNEVD